MKELLQFERARLNLGHASYPQNLAFQRLGGLCGASKLNGRIIRSIAHVAQKVKFNASLAHSLQLGKMIVRDEQFCHEWSL